MQSIITVIKQPTLSDLTVVRKYCLNCRKQITKGRADKMFCGNYCRTAYNNSLKSDANNLLRNIKNALGKNRRIIKSLLSEKEETVKVTRDILLQEGFNFKYHTHTQTNKKGQIYHYCFEYGYLALDNDLFLLVRYKE